MTETETVLALFCIGLGVWGVITGITLHETRHHLILLQRFQLQTREHLIKLQRINNLKIPQDVADV